MPSPRDTIFALSSGRGVSALAVIRISGPRAGDALQILTGRIPVARKAALVTIRDAYGDKEEIDQALALWFPEPNSETGENVAELQVHGGRAVIEAVLTALSRLKGLRPAEPGEFTRRGFENGKLDLTQVEGLADLIMADTQGQRRQALRQLKGLIGERAEVWRGRLIAALAMVEARIDFPDEADVPEDLMTPALRIARELAAEIETALADSGRGERLREGLVVAIAGPPNAGKSTLLNRLARREAAIVSPYAGTTRDVIEVHLDLGGWPVTLLDTAGIRPTDDPVEAEGVRRARERAAAADLVLWISEAGGPAADMTDVGTFSGRPVWLVRTKADLLVSSNEPEFGRVESKFNEGINQLLTNNTNDLLNKSQSSLTDVSNEQEFSKKDRIEPKTTADRSFILSALTGEGLDSLLTALTAEAAAQLGGSDSVLITRARHRHVLQETLAAMRRATADPAVGREDLIAEELRLAGAALGRLTGRIDVEDVLDVIFRDFCIGK
jgi:tRNA modification GTPase